MDEVRPAPAGAGAPGAAPRAARPRRTWRGRLLALLLGLLACELGLRAAGWVALATAGRGASGEAGGRVVLCHGDSNVFGVYERAADAYPARLQALLDADPGAGVYRVVNAGVPGLSSRQLLDSLPSQLERWEPELVLVTVGNNNTWSWTAEGGVEYLRPPLHERLQVVKLLRVVVARLRGRRREPIAPHGDLALLDDGGADGVTLGFEDRLGRRMRLTTGTARRTLDEESRRAVLREDLAACAALAAEHGAELVIVGYGADQESYGETNALLREIAAEEGLVLVDPAPALAELAARVGFDQVFHLDLHPRALGYEAVARVVRDELVRAGRLAGSARDLGLAGLEPRAEERVRFRVVPAAGRDGAPCVEIAGEEPGRPFTLVLWGASLEKPERLAASYTEFLADPLFQLTLGESRLVGVVGPDGRGRVDLADLCPREKLAELSGAWFQAAAVIHGKDDRRVPSRITGSALLRLP